MKHLLSTWMMFASLALCACGPSADEAADVLPEKQAPAAPAVKPSKPAFDVATVPVSTQPLGAFPYFELPQGYRHVRRQQRTIETGRFPFWTGDRFEWVEGRIHQTAVIADDGARFSEFGLVKNIERLVSDAGGVRVVQALVPAEAIDALAQAAPRSVREALGDVRNSPVTTYVIRRSDRDIWLHLCASRTGAAWVLAETVLFVPTAKLLPSADLQQQIDATGKAAVYIGFASGQARLLPEAAAQIAEILALLEHAPALRLSVEGHTDGTGNDVRNRLLSQARADAVRKALTDAGIDAARLQTRGFGHDRPLADDATEAGKALNRRVELVRL